MNVFTRSVRWCVVRYEVELKALCSRTDHLL